MLHRPGACRRCGRPFTARRRHATRGLDQTCRTAAAAEGVLHTYPPVRPAIDPDQLATLEAAGLDTTAIALRLGVTSAGVRQHRRRRRRAGA
ncbi:hypothetical protein FHS23_004613 [Prauserella isguenensis]|uniref:Uncharacterized protein n=1 Tax=Prauserella isguenensis TaxID=1470180 RepID=A0A839SA68_9PSEU|nr:hypothetical protein [Prauserella isguenensis]MBB3053559.1 hypothetical protein [Prauserella isguenensis]